MLLGIWYISSQDIGGKLVYGDQLCQCLYLNPGIWWLQGDALASLSLLPWIAECFLLHHEQYRVSGGFVEAKETVGTGEAMVVFLSLFLLCVI